ncbi:MAG: conjugal transfer protein TraN [Thiothrix sp.]|uniref:conjugal transfer protein TraN n=1 Tax=Thiothrix sp. TaxID=1032 RepID=UPI00260E20E5|nr:conjugal transfer protein TraN [Thiothrix sp.]MDD5395011.1 conjugal transfer protein TraN [Thiothrix sp.]
MGLVRACITLLLAASLSAISISATAVDCRKTGTVCLAGLTSDPHYQSGVTVVTPCKTFQGSSVCLSSIGKTCWGKRNTYTCIKPDAVNYCQPFINLQPKCQQASAVCAQTDTMFGTGCMRHTRTFRCDDPVAPTPTNTIKLDNSYTLTEDRIDESQCVDEKANGTCTLAEHKCTEAGGTRNINGLNVTKDCWAWEDTYTCLGNRQNSCEDLEAKGCKKQAASTCVDKIPNGTCQVWDVEYLCNTPGTTTTTEDCSNKGFCLEGKCFDSSNPPDADFAKAIAGMEVAREAGQYLSSDMQIFKGTDERCSIKLSGLKNCCKSKGGAKSNQSILMGAALAGGKALLDYSFQKGSNYMYDFMFSKGNNWMTQKAVDAWASGAWNPTPSTSMSFYGLTISYTSGTGFAFVGFDPASFALQVGIYLLMQFLSCTEDEAYLQMKRGSNLCHYVGTYCSGRFLGYCYERKQSYCCFNSRLARIIQEQGRPQLGKGWGGGDSPNCSGFTPDELERLDFGAMDLSEFMAEILANVKVPDASTVNGLVQKQGGIVVDKVQRYYQNGGTHP